MGSTIKAYDRISDVDVIMSVIRPQMAVGLGNLLLINSQAKPVESGTNTQAQTLSDTLTSEEIENGLLLRKTDKNTGAVYREYKNLDAVKIDYTDNEAILMKAESYFTQDNHSDRIAILDLPAGKEQEALGAFWFFNWTFAIRAKSDDDKAALTTLSNIFEANKDHFLVIQTDDVSLFKSLQGQNYTIGLKHDLSEPMDAAFVGAIATLPVGSTTWKFKTLQGISPESLTANELNSINKVNAIAYTTVFGKDQTTEGKSLSGEYIDTLHGIIWVKNEMQAQLEKLLQSNNKLPYDQTGINMVLATATQVLTKAFEKGIILTDANGKADYTVSATPRQQQSAQDLSDRHYGGLSFTYHASGAIHSLTIHGSVNSDTILQ
ncbi:MAG: DUF3383 domain-containing protein [Lactobacillus panisapium]|nr:DUF3383 domain-containing protein [Lactobacillus panisapium]